MIRAVHKTGSWVPLLHAACKQIVTSEAVGVFSAYKESFWGQRWVKCIPTVKWITELGRQSELGSDVHVVGWLGLGAGGGGGGTFCFCFYVCLFVVAQHWFHAIHGQSPSRTLGQDTRDLASDFAWVYTACFYCRQISVFTTSDLFEITWMLQK